MTAGRVNGMALLIVSVLILSGCHAQMGARPSTLHRAVANQDAAAVTASIANGADVHATDQDGKTPLHVAAQYEHAKITKLLLQAGADAEARDKDNGTPLHVAAQYEHATAVTALLEHGADVEARDKHGKTPREYAIDPRIIRLLDGRMSHDTDSLTPRKERPHDQIRNALATSHSAGRLHRMQGSLRILIEALTQRRSVPATRTHRPRACCLA